MFYLIEMIIKDYFEKEKKAKMDLLFLFVSSSTYLFSLLNIKIKSYHETLEQVAYWGCECPPCGSIQGQVGWCCDQSGLEGGVPDCSRGLKLDDLQGPIQLEPFYDSS